MPDSWWLKFKRAQRHMVEIRHAARAYAERKPYQISRVREPKGKLNRRWSYKLTMDPLDPMLVMMLGDFIHNLRSALDHVVVANSLPKFRHSAGFPVESRDLFALDGEYNFIHPDSDARESFNNAIRGLPFLLKTFVIVAQPYRSVAANTHVVGVLSRLENVDKHKKAISVVPSLRGGSVDVSIMGIPFHTLTLDRNEFLYDGAEVYYMTVKRESVLTDAEVSVESSGSPTVTIQATGIEGQVGLLELSLAQTMLIALGTVRVILRAMDRAAKQVAS